jgi:hypothetical protein
LKVTQPFRPSFFVELITPLRATRWKPNPLERVQKLDAVRLKGAGVSARQRIIWRICARSRPMRIFPIAFENYDSFETEDHATRAPAGELNRNRSYTGDELSAHAQDPATMSQWFRGQMCNCAKPARTCTKNDQNPTRQR